MPKCLLPLFLEILEDSVKKNSNGIKEKHTKAIIKETGSLCCQTGDRGRGCQMQALGLCSTFHLHHRVGRGESISSARCAGLFPSAVFPWGAGVEESFPFSPDGAQNAQLSNREPKPNGVFYMWERQGQTSLG